MIALKSLFIRNVLKVSSGTFLAQILMLIGMPIITRLYSKEIIGIYALFISTIGITTSFVTLAFDNTLVLPEKNKDANALLKVTLFVTVILSFIIFLILQLPINFFEEYKVIAIFIAFGTFLQVMINSLNYFKVRHEFYNQLSTSKVLRNFTLLLMQVGLFYVNSFYGLLFGFILASVFTILYLIRKDNYIKQGLFQKQSLLVLLANIKRYKEYPKYFCWSNLIFALSSGLPIIIFNEYFSLEQIAIYSIAFSIIIQPASLISSSIRPVLLSKLARKKNTKESILFFYNKGFNLLLISGIILSLFIYFILPPIVVLIFGQDWAESAELTRMLIPIFIWYFVSIPSSVSLKVYPFQKHAFYYTLFSFLVIILTLLGGVFYNFQFKYVVLFFSAASLLSSILNHFIVRIKIVKFEMNLKL